MRTFKIDVNIGPCAAGSGCNIDGFFCCGPYCCSPGEECAAGRCRQTPPPPVTTVTPTISVGQWTPNNCTFNPDGSETCPSFQAPQYSISGNSFSQGNVDVGIYGAD